MELQVGDILYKCQNCKKDFVIELEDFHFYEKIKVPPPTHCPHCRFVRRAVFRNEHYLFKKEDSRTGDEIFSAYPKDSAIKIYKNDFWWGDSWDPMEYGFDYDFSTNFFEQFYKLQINVPWCARSISNSINSDYCNNASDLKNCYMAFSMVSGENLFYGVGVNYIKDSVDFYHVKDSTFCYQAFGIVDSYKVFYSTSCGECNDVWFSKNCRDCSDCFGCVNLSHKKYHIFNEPYSKEEYQTKIKEFNLGSYGSLLEIKKKVEEFQKNFPLKFMHTMQSPNSSGDNIYGSKNARKSFHIYKSENVKFSQGLYKGKDSYDYTLAGSDSELIYECTNCTSSSSLSFCLDCRRNCSNLEYCANCYSCSDCFGCVGLTKKQYCIFNKQYTKEEYFSLRKKLIEHMEEMPYIDKRGNIYKYGEFFPVEFSPFAYNESLAFDYLPMEQTEVLDLGYAWRDSLKRNYVIEIKSEDLPDNILDTGEDVVNKTIACVHSETCECNCTGVFKIVPEEFQFYKRFNLPIPRFCPNCRFKERIKELNSLNLFKRKCDCVGVSASNGLYKNSAVHFHGSESCPQEFETPYSPDDPKIVYCEKCYQGEVY